MNWYKKAQSYDRVRYMGTVLAEVMVPFGGFDREYAVAAMAIGGALRAAENAAPPGISLKFTPQGDYEKVT